MDQILFDFVVTLAGLLRLPLIFFSGCFGLFVFLVFIHIVIGHFQGKRFKKGVRGKKSRRPILLRLFLDLPKQYAADIYAYDPEFFRYQGMIIYTGRQGNGKTISMIRDCRQMQKEYPLCKCITNLGYTMEDDALRHWRQLVDYVNGRQGIIVAIDELQNWFSSNQSKNFPPEMLQVITQNRKNRRIILGTAQNFYLLAKAIRSQCTEVRECVTFLGCLTFVRRKEPILDASGEVVEWKSRGMYFFVHDKELREAYDTYRVISLLASSGFQNPTEQFLLRK